MTKTPEELTKEWKAGELEDGLYYILLENGKTPISELETWYRTNIEESKEYYETEQAFYGYSDNMISEVLAPIPTYDEYKAMQDHILYLEKCISIYEQKEKQHTNDSIEYNKLEKENNNLRALLRECYKKADEALQEIQKDCEADEWTIYHYKNVQEFYNLLTRINSALGESEA
jgi:hypothetical protein